VSNTSKAACQTDAAAKASRSVTAIFAIYRSNHSPIESDGIRMFKWKKLQGLMERRFDRATEAPRHRDAEIIKQQKIVK